MAKHLFLTSSIHGVVGSVAAKIDPKVQRNGVFIDTCIRDGKHADLYWHERNKDYMNDAGFTFESYDIVGKSNQQLRDDLSQYEYIYVEGGNTYYLLQAAQQNGFGDYVRERVEQGLIYISTSAGSVIAGLDTRSVVRPGKTYTDYNLTDTSGFKLVNFNIIPHWGHPKKKADHAKYKIPKSYNQDYPYILLSDSQYVEVVGDSYNIIDVTQELRV